jgi:hypothetical protein
MKTMLTDRALRAMKTAAHGPRKLLWDAPLPSFEALVAATGKLTFIVMRRLRDKPVRRMLGQYPIMTLSKAREAALEALWDIERGIRPERKESSRLRRGCAPAG